MPTILSIGEFAASIGKTSPVEFNESLLIKGIVDSAEQAIFSWLGVKLTNGAVVELLPVGSEIPTSLGELDWVRTTNRVYLESDRRFGLSSLKLSKPPVLLANLRIWVDEDANGGQASGAFADATELVAGEDFFLDVEEPTAAVPLSRSGVVYRVVGEWPQTPRCIKASYTSGATAAWLAENAAVLKSAALIVAGARYRTFQNIQAGRGPITSERLKSYSYSTGDAGGGSNGTLAAFLGGGGPTIPANVQQDLAPLRKYSAFLGG